MTFIRRKVQRMKSKKTIGKLGMTSAAIVTTQLVPFLTTNIAHAASYSQQDFINQVGNVAREVAHENDLYASVMIAQAILESNWGKSGLSYNANNLFGIKGSYNGQSVTMRTAEQRVDGSVYYLNEPFRQYPTIKESMLDYVSVVKGSRYYSGAWKSNTTSYQQATKHLTGRYATAINYNTVLNNIIVTYNLTRFDTPNSSYTPNVSSTSSTQANTTTNPVQSNGMYTVKRGDSVWSIAMTFNMPMSQVVSLNNIKNYFIYPGQQLRVSDNTQTNRVTTQQTVALRSANYSTMPQVKATQSQQTSEYTVVRGDSVWKISKQHGISMNTLVSLNNIKNYFIYPGQKLIISRAETASQQTKNETATQSTVTYQVKAGDSVWLIANKFGISMTKLRQSNNIKNNFIYPGQQLHIK